MRKTDRLQLQCCSQVLHVLYTRFHRTIGSISTRDWSLCAETEQNMYCWKVYSARKSLDEICTPAASVSTLMHIYNEYSECWKPEASPL